MVDFTSTAIERINNTPSFSEAVEKAIIEGDYNKLTPDERIKYYHAVCHSVGLNPLTRPFDAMKSQDGSYKLYARKEAAEQLRKIYNVSIKTTLRERIGDLYFVSVEASMPGGRTETSEAVVSLTKVKKKQSGSWPDGNPKFSPVYDENGDEVEIPLKGEALANAMMRCETKAKRRVTLSICGLGFSEAGDYDYIDVSKTTAEPIVPYMGDGTQAVSDLGWGDGGIEVSHRSLPSGSGSREPEGNPFHEGGIFYEGNPVEKSDEPEQSYDGSYDFITQLQDDCKRLLKHTKDRQKVMDLINTAFGVDKVQDIATDDLPTNSKILTHLVDRIVEAGYPTDDLAAWIAAQKDNLKQMSLI